MEIHFVLYVSVLFKFLILDVRALKNMHIIVPEVVRRGSNVTLICDYDLESVPLYSIKWYKDDEEFYRYVPKESPPAQDFHVAHVKVEISASNSSRVTLTSVERGTSGEFKCEVSADAPFFHTEIRPARLLVADVPDDGPVLKVEAQKLAPGAYLKANCTSPGSYPAINITWFVNDKQMHSWDHNVDGDAYFDAVNIENSIFHFDALPGLETVQSTFSMKTRPDLFDKSKLRLRCLATMFTLYNAYRETEVQEDAPKLALVIDGQKDQRNGGTDLILNMDKLVLLIILSFVVSYRLRILQ